MTLIIALHGKSSVWLLADRRLTWPNRRLDNACKLITLTAMDGRGIMAYSGLGSSSKGTEPSEWMRDILIGHPGATVEQSLSLIWNAMKRELPKHLALMKGAQIHQLMATAIVNDQVRFYGAALELQPGMKTSGYCSLISADERGVPPRLCFAGSGSFSMPTLSSWDRDLFRTLAAFEAGKVGARNITDRLARINYLTSLRDASVSPESIVVWSKVGGGGETLFYAGEEITEQDRPVANIWDGKDLNDIISILIRKFDEGMEDGVVRTEHLTEEHETFIEIQRTMLKPKINL